MSNDVAQYQEVDWATKTIDLMTDFTDTPRKTKETLTANAVQQKDMYQETINRVMENLGLAIGNAKKKLDKSFEEKPMPEVGGFTEEGLEQEVEKFVAPTTTDKQTEEVLTDAEDTDTASSAIDDSGKAQDNQPNLDDVPTGGLMGKPPSKDLSDLEPLGEGEPIINAYFNTSITGLDGNFSQVALEKALDDSVTNPYKQSLLKGTMDIEVGDEGPVEEVRYTEENINSRSTARFAVGDNFEGRELTANDQMVGKFKDPWRRRMIRDGVMAEDGNLINYSGTNVFNSVYANRNGNGNYASGDGDTYRGRGLIQITGKATYQAVDNVLESKGIDIDLVNNPELALDDKYALPVALAYLEHVGLNNNSAENSSAKELNNLINTGASPEVAEERWGAVVNALENAGEQDKAEEMQLRNEYAAQRISGTTVDGVIGPNSRRSMRAWLTENNVTVPENATDMQLVVLVNRNN